MVKIFRRSLCLVLCLLATPVAAQQTFITLASTTSTDNSGLFRHILPEFTAATAIDVHVVAVGTGAALRLGQAGDADVLLVHARDAEEAFIAQGYGAFRRNVMYNDFVIVGPGGDPANLRGANDAVAALRRIAAGRHEFVSRGDDSGTHRAEMRLWRAAGLVPSDDSGGWYKQTGAGMGATLNTTSSLDAHTLTDRGTWLSFSNRGQLSLLVEGDPRLFNQYGVILVDPARHPHVKAAEARAFIDWLTGPDGQRSIANFRINGEQLFVPNAGQSQ